MLSEALRRRLICFEMLRTVVFACVLNLRQQTFLPRGAHGTSCPSSVPQQQPASLLWLGWSKLAEVGRRNVDGHACPAARPARLAAGNERDWATTSPARSWAVLRIPGRATTASRFAAPGFPGPGFPAPTDSACIAAGSSKSEAFKGPGLIGLEAFAAATS